METIGERIRILRKKIKQNQTDFGKKIGIGQAGLSAIEKNDVIVTDRNISLICQAFNVRREWLEKGEGEMFLPMSRADAVMAWAERISKEPSGFPHQFAAALAQLDVSDWQVLERLARALAAASPQAPASAEPPASDLSPAPEHHTTEGVPLDPTIEEEVAKYRARRYAQEKTRRICTTSPDFAASATSK